MLEALESGCDRRDINAESAPTGMRRVILRERVPAVGADSVLSDWVDGGADNSALASGNNSLCASELGGSPLL